MTPESIQLAREITEAAIFDTGERRTECRRQALLNLRPEDLHGEVRRLDERIKALRKLECELKQEAAVPEPSGGGDIFS